MSTWNESERLVMDTVVNAAGANLSMVLRSDPDTLATAVEAWDALREVRESMRVDEYDAATEARIAMQRAYR